MPSPPRNESAPSDWTAAVEATLKLNRPPPALEAPKVRASVEASVAPEDTTTEPLLIVSVPVVVFAAPPSVRTPAPLFVIVPVEVVTLPVTVVLPVPPTARLNVPVTLASVVVLVTARVEKLLLVLSVPAPVSVSAPNVRPAEPELIWLPRFEVSVNAPSESVPSVCVTPAPKVRRSAITVVFALTVALRAKFSPVSLARMSVEPPPLSVSEPVPSAAAFVVARSVPAESVMAPLSVFAPLSVRIPVPDFVNVVPATTELIVASPTVLTAAPVLSVSVLAPATVKPGVPK